MFQSTFLIRDLTGKELLIAVAGEAKRAQLPTILLPNICAIAGIYWDRGKIDTMLT